MFKHLIGSLVLASSLVACATVAPSKPDPVQPSVVVAPAKKLDRNHVRAALAARRDVVFERFLAYREGRVYPVAPPGDGMQHVWVDQQGNLCAAATLVSQDLGRDAAIAVVDGNNSIELASVHDGALAEWMLTSGLTHHEIVAIQRPGFSERQKPVEGPRLQDEIVAREAEVQRLYTGYISVERQLRTLWDENLEAATDALMAHPDLARDLVL